MNFFKKLVGYRLVTENKRLLVAKGKKTELAEIMSLMKETEPDNNFVIETFAVLKVALTGSEVKEWKKISGHSLWQVVGCN